MRWPAARWRVSNLELAAEFAAEVKKYEHKPLRRRLMIALQPIALLVLVVCQPLCALIILTATMSLASQLTGPPPALAFWIVAGILALLNAAAALGAWSTVIDRVRSRIVDPHAILLAIGLTAGFGLAAIWIWA